MSRTVIFAAREDGAMHPRAIFLNASLGFYRLWDGMARRYLGWTDRREGAVETHHDDWSCFEDLVAAGLVTAAFRDRPDAEERATNGYLEARVAFTPRGREVASRLRAHKAAGGSFADFTGEVAPATGEEAP